jgi:hypothetical protein
LDVTGTLRSTGEGRFDNGINLKTATLNYVYFDDAVSFTRNGTGERMRIDSSGNVGIGTSSPATKLNVIGDIQLSRSATASDAAINFGSNSNNYIYGGNSANLMAFATNGSERARIDSSGNLLLGTTSAAGAGLTIANSNLWLTATGYSSWKQTNFNGGFYWNNGSDRMLLDSSGNLLVGTTTQQGRLTVNGGTGLVQAAHIEHPGDYSALQIKATGGSFADNVLLLAANRGASSAFQLIRGGANGVDQFRVAGNGVIFAQNTTVQSISDQRLKENIRDSSDGLDVITSLRPVRYDWKEGYGNDRKDQLGFIAQEVESVFPEAVSEWQVSREDETVYKTVGPGALIPVLVKAIQELKAEFDAYKASHP